MGKGNRMRGVGGIGAELSSSSLGEEEYNVGLDLKMQPTDHQSFVASQRMVLMQQPPSHPEYTNSSFGVGAYGYGGGSIFCNTSNQVTCVSDIYDAVGAAAAAAAAGATSVGGGAKVLPKTLSPFSSDTAPFKSSVAGGGGGMAAAAASNYGKIAAAAFTWSQWEELERQTLIYKYMMASIPVPPELLFPISKRPPQSNNSAWDMRNGTDPEPWRCRRTDGKKWRCSRDVAPDQKYCERHAHKTRPRSRKHVEAQSHTTTKTTTTTVNNYTQHPLILSTDFASAASYDQSRCTEWFMKGGTSTVPVSTSSQQWQQLMQSSTREGLTRNNLERDKNFCGFQHYYEDIQEPMDLNQNRFSVQRLENHQQLNDHGSLFDTKFCDRAHTTRHFLDDWSMGVKEEHVPPNRKLHISSLSLSMAGGIGIGVENEHAQMGLGMITSDRESSGALKSKWLWDNSPPGGPLGEALCLGIAGSAKGYSNLPSPHGHGCSNSTTTSSCSKSSCEDDTRARSFIR